MRLAIVVALVVSACSPDDVPVEMPTAPVFCGGGADGEVLGSLTWPDGAERTFTPAPAWWPQSGEAPSTIIVASSNPSLLLLLDFTTQPPAVGTDDTHEAYVSMKTSQFFSQTLHLVIDESDASRMPACVAGRFSATFDFGQIAGWFRTR